jgi:hypothetical protein
MADTKITVLTAITTVDPAVDVLPIVDISDTTMAASGTTKKITSNQILGAGGTATLASATITGDLTVATDRLKVVTGSTAVQIGATTQTQIGTTAWPSTDIGKSNARFLVGNEGIVINWNESSPVIGNYSSIFAGAKTGIGATTIGGLQIRAGIENASNRDGFCSFWTSNQAAGGYVKRYEIDSNGVSTWSVGGSTAMTLNASGLLGLGVAPKTWSSGLAFEVSSLLKIASSSLFGAAIANNAYYNVGWKYSTANTANLYQTISGEHRWLNAPSGTADAAITFTQAMTLDASGNLLVGPTSSVYKLDTYTTLQGTVTSKQFANRTSNKIIVKRFFGISADTALFSVECGTAGAGAMAAFEINVFATGQKSGSSSDRQFYGKFYVTRNLAGTFTITSAFSSGSSGAFTVTASGTSLNVNGIFSVISDGSACVEITGYIGGRDTVAETALTVTMP